MNHADHVRLLEKGVPAIGGRWADFGSGDGAFTLALADLLGPAGEIHSIDRDSRALARQKRRLAERFPETRLLTYVADFRQPLDLPSLDGLVVANALHFLAEKEPAVRSLSGYLRPDGRFIVVEYDTDSGNHWVPYPFSYRRWTELAASSGLGHTELLARAPSSFLGAFYAAVSLKGPG
ncbi:MAG: methyltransferase domain-containing protein [Chloroflexota bacterium]|jgi:ubiquinone/menaquinone biosynthesis C-methylase UbiE